MLGKRKRVAILIISRCTGQQRVEFYLNKLESSVVLGKLAAGPQFRNREPTGKLCSEHAHLEWG
jgi:hypothetical protein